MFARAPHKTIIALTFLTILAALLNGCSSWFVSDFQDPRVHLVRVDVVKARLLEQRFNLRFRIENPNDFTLFIRGLAYDIQLNGAPLATGESNESWYVPALSTREFTVPIRTNLWRHLKAVVNSLEDTSRPIQYQLRGEVKTGRIYGPSVHLQRNGEIIPDDYIPE